MTVPPENCQPRLLAVRQNPFFWPAWPPAIRHLRRQDSAAVSLFRAAQTTEHYQPVTPARVCATDRARFQLVRGGTRFV